MAKNRKSESGAVRFGPVMLAIILCIVFGGSGIGYVWQKNQIHILSQTMKEREARLAELRRQNKMRQDHLATQVSPPALEARVKKLNLGLVQPQLSQIVRLVETPPSAPAAGRDDKSAEQQIALITR